MISNFFQLPSRIEKSWFNDWWWTVDRTMLGLFIVLGIVGIFMVSTASPPVASHLGLSPYHFVIKHIIVFIPAFAALLFLSFMTPRWVWRISSIIFAGSLACLVLVLFVGSEIKGAQRWINLYFFALQPSEFIKPAFIVVAAWLLSMQDRDEPFKFDLTSKNLIVGGLYFCVVSLLLLQPDLGMVFIITAVFATQIFMAGLPFRYLIVFGMAGLGGLTAAYYSFSHVQSRIDRFLNPESGDNYQVEKSLSSFENGGLFGTGPGQGSVKMNLPDAHADFIFAVSAEEMGILFSFIFAGLFLLIVLRGFQLLLERNDLFTVLAAGGLLTLFGLQAFIHMGSVLSLLPTKGMTLPFISYGGSSLLSIAMTSGFILALTRKRRFKYGVSKMSLSLASLKAQRTNKNLIEKQA